MGKNCEGLHPSPGRSAGNINDPAGKKLELLIPLQDRERSNRVITTFAG